MLFWIIAALLSLGVVFFVTRPFFKDVTEVSNAAAYDVEVYKRQLRELEREVSEGLVSEQEAGAARAEIGRRLLRADATLGEEGTNGTSLGLTRALTVILALTIPASATAVYLAVGQPGAVDAPYAGRLAEVQQARAQQQTEDGNLGAMARQLSERLENEPEDGDGWLLLARTYMALQRFADAVVAFDRAAQIKPQDPMLFSSMGEAMVFKAEGVVTPEAVNAFQRAANLSGDTNVEPRSAYYLAQGLYQTGRRDEALNSWIALAQAGAPTDPWYPAVYQRVLEVSEELGKPVDGVIAEPQQAPPAQIAASGSSNAPGPTAEDVEAAAQLSPEERAAMIEGMINGLAARLEDEPGDFDGWMRLIRARSVSGDVPGAERDLATALEAFSRAPFPRRALLQLAQEFDLTPPDGFSFDDVSSAPATNADTSGSTSSETSSAPGPTAEDMAAAQEMSEEDRMAMIEGMVAGLAARLEDEPNNREGWFRLARSYNVLGRPEEAVAALENASKAFPDDNEFKLLRARVLRAMQNTQTTVTGQTLLAEVVATDPTNVEANWFLAIGAISTGDKEAARGFFDAALSGLPDGSQEKDQLRRQSEALLQ